MEVTGYPSIIEPEDIEVVSAGTGLTYRGNFNSSNQLLNDMHASRHRKTMFSGNCLFCHVLGLMGEIASVLGYSQDRGHYHNHAARLYEAINKNLYILELKRFADCCNSNQSHQGTNVK